MPSQVMTGQQEPDHRNRRGEQLGPQENTKHLTESGTKDGGQLQRTQGNCTTQNIESGNISSQEEGTPREESPTDNCMAGGQDWQDEWIYLGHGEWQNSASQEATFIHGNPLEEEQHWVKQWLQKVDPDIQLHNRVLAEGYPNRWGARIEVKSKWNLELLECLLAEYEDKEIVEWLRFGWPMGRLPTLKDPCRSNKNHTGAADYPQELRRYIAKELEHEAVMGPYKKIPFNGKVGVAPLSTRPKKDSKDRRVILDLSFPVGTAVNDGIPKDSYMGIPTKLTFPRVDDFAARINGLRQRCLMFKVDLSRYFRQIPLDPGDYSLIGYVINGDIYFDKVLPMGMRSAPYIAQRITNAIVYIHGSLQFFLLNYVDDFIGAEHREVAWKAYKALTELLKNLRVETATNKMVPPTTRLEFLGITFDSEKMTMEISEDKLAEIKMELQTWLIKTKATRREAESLVGKLQFMAKCIRAGRTFLGRLIQWIRTMDRRYHYPVPQEARKDIVWWGRFATQFNGRALVWLSMEPTTDSILQTDACPRGMGGICGQEYFKGRFPSALQNKNIAILEMWAVMVGLKIWAKSLAGKYFWIHVDNEAVATVLNSGSSRDPELQNALREIAYIAAKHEFVIKARHISGISNRIPDWLSRWHEPESRKAFHNFAKDKSLKQVRQYAQHLQYDHKW